MAMFSLMLSRFRKLESKIAALVKTQTTFYDFPAVKSYVVGGNQFVYGLDWRYYANAQELYKNLHACYKTHINIYATANTKDMLGLGHGLDKTSTKGKNKSTNRGKSYSAALMAAENLSHGSGVELFVFEFEADLFGMTVLEDERPIGRFDQMGSRKDIALLIAEFKQEQLGQKYRVVGNSNLLENQEHAEVKDVFFAPAASVQIKSVPNFARRFLLGGAALIMLPLVVSIGSLTLSIISPKPVAQLVAPEAPDVIYDRQLSLAMSSLGQTAQDQLNTWRRLLLSLPESVNGWNLSSAECNSERCEALWTRDFGSYADFDSAPLQGQYTMVRSQSQNDPSRASIRTTWPAPTLNNNPPPQHSIDTLETVQNRVYTLASQLQDLTLVDEGEVSITVAGLFPEVPGIQITQISKPVVKGAWSIQHRLWTLDDLEFNTQGLFLESIAITRTTDSPHWVYTLKGNYYAKGIPF